MAPRLSPVQAADLSDRPAVPVGRSLSQPKVAGDVPAGLSITSPPSIGCSRKQLRALYGTSGTPTIRDDLAAEDKSAFQLSFPRDGRVRFKSTRSDGSYIGFAIAPVHTEHLSKNVLEIATFGGPFDRAAREAQEALSDLEHLRQSLIYFVEPDDKDDLVHRDGLLDYVFSQLPEIKRQLGTLYRECSGGKLLEHRVR